MRTLRALISIVIVAMCAAEVSAQQSPRTKTPDRKSASKVPASWPYSYFDTGHSALNIPFEVDRAGRAFISGHANDGERLRILLDTGAAPTFVLTRVWAERLGLKLTEGYQIQGIGPKRGSAAVAKNVSVRLPGLTLTPLEVFVTSLQEPDPVLDPGIGRSDAILGFGFFKDFTVVMDYQKKFMSVYAPGSFEYRGSSKPIPVNIREGLLPYVTAKLTFRNGRVVEAPFVIDLGSSNGAHLYFHFVNQNRLLHDLGTLTPGSFVGEGGEIKGVFALGKSVEIAGIKSASSPLVGLESEVGGFSSTKYAAGSLGAPIFQGSRVVFDFPRLRMFWETGPGAQEKAASPKACRPSFVVVVCGYLAMYRCRFSIAANWCSSVGCA